MLKIFSFIVCVLISACHQKRTSQMPLTQDLSSSESDLSQEIGQMIMIGFQGTDVKDPHVQKALALARDGKIGGVIFFKFNILSPQPVKKLTTAFRQAQPNLLIALDQEGGKVQRLSAQNGFKDFPSPKEISETQSPMEAYQTYLKMAKMVKEAGFNLTFGPVVDLHADAEGHECPVIGKLGRSYSADIHTVVDYASAFIKAHRESGILTSLKHFPGHGYARRDSHKGMVDITATSHSQEQEVFYQLISGGMVDSIMTAHLVHQGWDPKYPATLSSTILKNRLRDKVKYNGILITDDLHMGAIGKHYTLEETIIQAIRAGNDILLFSNNKAAAQGVKNFKASSSLADEIHHIILKALKENKLSSAQIRESFSRVKSLKERLFTA